ncbi:LysE/ArgO family amino acid transporter [Agrococcus sp. TF02-05]|uniref:LysE/ArgO family amino acid transporter n=1 Tax=Agrococcus sp. TF02-05 TaxID=2815211 RepID=UPI001AA163DF|nr:LysE family transporter [Agrococcus sp. TF02-05]MBO1769183.1 LysE family transporter [Agrococcus sp. TF02-05]
MNPELVALLSGLGVCLGLIVSIGAQNAIVLRQGLRREHVGLVVSVCIASDVVLQTIGVAGVATVVAAHPWLETAGRWAGAIFLVGFAAVSARRAWRGGGSLEAAPEREAAGSTSGGGVATRTRSSRLSTLATILAVTWLNPQALVETTVVLGSIAAPFGEARWWFLAGGIAAASIWFVGFGYGARYLAPLMRTERAWRILDGGIAIVMLVIAVSLVAG